MSTCAKAEDLKIRPTAEGKADPAQDGTAGQDATQRAAAGKRLLTMISFQKSVPALALLLTAALAPCPARAQSAPEGQKLAFDRNKGNCLTCHEIKGGSQAGNIGPALADINRKYPNRADLVAIVTDETKRNPLTVMPPFGRNHILTDKEIDAVVDFLQTL
jgi:sulfur-oxidizing protein SoxX